MIGDTLNTLLDEGIAKFPVPESFKPEAIKNFEALIDEILNNKRQFYLHDVERIQALLVDCFDSSNGISGSEKNAIARCMIYIDLYKQLRCSILNIREVSETV